MGRWALIVVVTVLVIGAPLVLCGGFVVWLLGR
jgi:hypothetical protein